MIHPGVGRLENLLLLMIGLSIVGVNSVNKQGNGSSSLVKACWKCSYLLQVSLS